MLPTTAEPDSGNHLPAGGLTPPRRYGIRFDPAAAAMTVLAVDPGSPAERGGVKAGDVVTAIDGEPTAGMDLGRRMAAVRRPELTLIVERDGRSLTIHLRLAP
jgi:C-terminal processing protease CtpA/Prc